MKESEESRRLNGALAYATKIEAVEPELAREIRRKAWEESRERVLLDLKAGGWVVEVFEPGLYDLMGAFFSTLTEGFGFGWGLTGNQSCHLFLFALQTLAQLQVGLGGLRALTGKAQELDRLDAPLGCHRLGRCCRLLSTAESQHCYQYPSSHKTLPEKVKHIPIARGAQKCQVIVSI